MKWTSENITELRLSLGWSVADFSRRFGVASAVVQAWEAGQAAPSSDDLRQLDFLSFHSQSYRDVIAAQPQADSLLIDQNFEQIYRRDLKSK